MNEYIFGANILENLTTGMYQDSRVIYREYIQNACDQIDQAEKNGLLDKNQGKIEIWIDKDNRNISIEDNATGISANQFQAILGNIANSDKKIGEDKGFRGIGRLCGLAYCRELIFTSTYKGECTISMMRCDAQKMRELISNSQHGKKYTAAEVLSQIYDFSTEPTTNIYDHWFKVEMVDINAENKDLLNFQKIKDYLSFVAPVPYRSGTFCFNSEIYDFAKEHQYTIDEYTITLDGEQIFKKYKTNFKTSKGDDEIFNVEFKEFKDKNDDIIAWMWFGVSKFKAVISKECKMRGLRLRKENIQIGGEDALQKLFKEDRGQHYFVGEVFALSKELIPNSQRDYFNENDSRVEFENCLSEYFKELQSLYKLGSDINSSNDKIIKYEKSKAEFEEKNRNGDFIDKNHKEKAFYELNELKEKVEKAKKIINRNKNSNNDVIKSIINRLEQEQKRDNTTFVDIPLKKPVKSTEKITHRADKLSKLNRNERKLVSKIYSIIQKSTDEKTAELIIKKIEEEF